MKKILLFVVAIMLSATCAFAQEKKGSVGIGYMRPDFYFTGKDLNGFYVGFDLNVPLAKNFGVAPGLYYSCPMGKGNYSSYFDLIVEQYVGVPCNFFYSIDLSNGLRMNVFTGPTLSYGISSTEIVQHYKDERYYSTKDYYRDIKPGYYKRLDLLIGGGVAFDFSNTVRLTLGYNYGLRNRYGRTYNRSFPYVGVSYLF